MTRSIAALLFACASPLVVSQTSPNPLTTSGAPQARQVERAQPPAAPPVTLGAVSASHQLPNGVEIASENGRLQITVLQNDVIRVRATRGSEFPQRYSYAVLAVPAGVQSAAAKAQVRDAPDRIELSTGSLQVRVDRRDSTISFLAADGTPISRDAASITWQGETFTVTKSMPEDEHYYGLGDKAGPLDHRNQAFTMWNTDAYAWQESTDPLYKTLGFLVALRKGTSYGILLDNTYRQHWDLGKASADEYSFGADGGEVDYYFIYGPRPKQVVSTFTALVGRSPLPPLWSLGFQQCRYSYFPESRVREIVQTFKQKKIPLDVIYLDIDYQRENRVFTVDPQKFPNFTGMVRDFAKQGVRTIAITDLHIKQEPGYAPYDTGKAIDAFIKNPDGSEYAGRVWPGTSVFPDFTRKAVRDWWGGLYKEFVNNGVAGFWNDMNEPSVFDVPSKTMPVDAVDRVEEPGQPSRQTTQREIHNVLGMLNSQGTYEGLLKLRPNERPFVLTRATYVGGQRFAATWTGDNSSTWNHMRISVPMLQNLGISGFPVVGDDIGGYKGSPQPDLLTKWLELGAFNPIDRDHTEKGSADQEPWVHGPQHEAIRKRYIEERYRLLPYIYTGMEQSSRDGIPLMRPMFLEYPDQEPLLTEGEWANSQYLFGHDLLVAPQPYEFLQDVRVMLPSGNVWYDYWTGKQLQSGEITVKPALDTLHVYVRGGAIIPRQPLIQSTAEKPQGPLELRVYPDRTCQGSLYMDDGVSFDYTHGKYLRVDYTCEGYEDALRMKISPQLGSFTPWFNEVQAVIYGVKRQPVSITLDGKAVKRASFDSGSQTLTLQFPYTAGGGELRLSCGSPGQKSEVCFAMGQPPSVPK
ncbi:MAG TPA: TIM-barrel domain-containing protein [Terriglobales bacterium]|jgi:alpha-glucosidase|nr:TIM-barrel domain-containing protein [Terriglobales bacterium]